MSPVVSDNEKFPQGSVRRILLVDFLTYDQVEVHPAPGLNLLIGPNGTGKSTMLCALCLGLAGSPKTLGRSTYMDDYIKRDKEFATIEIELSSGDEYCNPVIKTIIRRGKGKNKVEYYINNTRKEEKEVRDFVSGHHIQVDNLCQFLAQDKVVEFARQSKQNLLKNTEKAAGSENLYVQHTQLSEQFEDGVRLRKVLDTIGERKTALQQKVASLERPFMQYQEYESRKAKLQSLENKRLLVEYESLRAESENVKTQVTAAKAELKQRDDGIKPLQQRHQRAKEVARRAEVEFMEQKRGLNTAKTKIDTDLNRFTVFSERIEVAKADLEQARAEFQSKTEKVRTLEEAVANLRTALETSTDQDLTPQIQQKEREVAAAKRTLDEADRHCTEMEVKLRTEQERLMGLSQHLTQLENQRNGKLRELQTVDRTVHDAYVFLTQNRQRFKGEVWLPALDIRVPNQADFKYLENCIPRRDLLSFVFEHFADMQLFLDLLKEKNIRVGCGTVPDQHVDISPVLPPQLRAQNIGFQNFVCNLFDAPHGVKKYLTNLCYLDRIPVGNAQTEKNMEGANEAVKQFRITRFLTPNKTMSITNSRYGGTSIVHNQALQEARMLPSTVSRDDTARENELKEQKRVSTAEVERMQHLIREQNERKRESRRVFDTATQEKEDLKKRATQRTGLISQITYKQRQLDQARTQVPNLNEQERSCADRLKSVVDEKVRLLKSITDLAEKVAGMLRERSTTSVKHASSANEALSIQRQLDDADVGLREFRERYNQLQTEYAEKKTQVRSLMTRVFQAFRIDMNHPEQLTQAEQALKDLPNDMEQLDDAIETQRGLLSTAEVDNDRTIVDEYRTRVADLRHMTEQEAKAQTGLQSWETNVAGIRDEWLTGLTELIETISRNFSRFMAVLECAGEVQLETPDDINNFNQYGIRIQVKFRDNEPLRELDPNHQSGGERSVSTMLYMLALQELSHVPFCCVDEINQGMDPINERKVFEIMTKLLSGETEESLKSTQYFMLTPKLLHGLEMGEDIAVWVIHNGCHMMPNDEWKLDKFIRRKRALVASLGDEDEDE